MQGLDSIYCHSTYKIIYIYVYIYININSLPDLATFEWVEAKQVFNFFYMASDIRIHLIYVVDDIAMTMGNIVPRAGSESTSLALQASVLIITPCRLHDVTTIPMPT